MTRDRGFEDFYRELFPVVVNAAAALSGSKAMAEDAAQEAFARALARWSRLQDQSWSGGWVMTTALNCAKKALRRSKVSPPIPDRVDDVEARLDIWRAVRALPDRQQQAVVLRYVMDLPLAGIAGAMGCSEGTVKAHLATARDSIARHLGGERVDR